MTGVGKVIPQERAANVINSIMLGPGVAVEIEPNVCVIKYPRACVIK